MSAQAEGNGTVLSQLGGGGSGAGLSMGATLAAIHRLSGALDFLPGGKGARRAGQGAPSTCRSRPR